MSTTNVFRCLAFAVGLALPSLGGPARAAPVAAKAFLTGPVRVAVRAVPREIATESFRFEFDGDRFTATPLGGSALAGSFRASRRSPSRLVCRFSRLSLDALGVRLAAAASAAIEGHPSVTAHVRGQSLVVALGETRASQTLRASFGVTFAGGGRRPVPGRCVIRGNAVPRRVLLLDDAQSGPQVAAALRAAGDVVVEGGNYYEWDGSSPALADAETVVWLQGWRYSNPLESAADDALSAFVTGGGGLVRTEWAAWNRGAVTGTSADALLPVTATDKKYEYTTVDVAVTDGASPLVRGLPSAFTLADVGSADVTAIPGATVVAQLTRGHGTFPAVTYATFGQGTVVHVNHDLTYTSATIAPETLRILVNAAEFTAP
jgi:hypothetical protein